MAGEVERYRRPTRYKDPSQPGYQTPNPMDPRSSAYQAGMELAQQSGHDMVRPDDEDPFNHPFFAGGFEQGQTRSQITHKKSVHVISEAEYILTEETTTTETFSFGNNIFQEWRRNRRNKK
jgi:hypothetical protein